MTCGDDGQRRNTTAASTTNERGIINQQQKLSEDSSSGTRSTNKKEGRRHTSSAAVDKRRQECDSFLLLRNIGDLACHRCHSFGPTSPETLRTERKHPPSSNLTRDATPHDGTCCSRQLSHQPTPPSSYHRKEDPEELRLFALVLLRAE